MKIAFVTDSGIGKTAQQMAADNIISLPLQISVDGRNLQDMEEIDKDQLIALLHQQKDLATSLPSLGRIQECFEKLKAEGKSILMISEELPEVIGMSDRILVLKDGEIQKEFMRGPEVTESVIIEYMI